MYETLLRSLCSAKGWGTGLDIMEILANLSLGKAVCPRLGMEVEVQTESIDLRVLGVAALQKCGDVPCPLCKLQPKYFDFAKVSKRDGQLTID